MNLRSFVGFVSDHVLVIVMVSVRIKRIWISMRAVNVNESEGTQSHRAPAEIPQRERFLNATMFSLVAIPFLAIVAQFLREIQHAHTPHLRFSAYDDAVVPAGECKYNESSKRVVSMSLFGPLEKYTIGALRNAERMPSIYPGSYSMKTNDIAALSFVFDPWEIGWTLRIYMNRSNTSTELIAALEDRKVEIVDVIAAGLSSLPPMVWRFAVALDPSVDRYVVRDADRLVKKRCCLCRNEALLHTLICLTPTELQPQARARENQKL